TRQVCRDGHVGAQVQVDRLFEQLGETLLEVMAGVVPIEVVVDLPIPLRLNPATRAYTDQVARKQLADAAEQCLAGQAQLEPEVVLEAFDVDLDRGQERQQ